MNRIALAAHKVHLLTLVLALLLALLPAAAFAAPALQAGDPLVFISDVLPSASTPGRIVTLTLQQDGSATLATDYMNGDAAILETAEWVANEEEQTLTLTVTGQNALRYDTPFVIVFAVGADGTIAMQEWDRAVFGSQGFSLAVVEDAAAAEAAVADAMAAVEATAEPTPEATEAADEATVEPTVIATATVTASSPATATAPVTVRPVAEPVIAPAAETVDASAAGVYVSDILPSGDTPGQVVFIILYADGTVQGDTYYLNGEAPIMEVGVWEEDADSLAVTVTISGTVEAEYPQPQVFAFTRSGNSLSYLGLTLNKIGAARVAAAPQATSYFQTDVLPAASSPGLQISLVFMDDNSAFMLSDYQNDEAPIIELGTWEDNDDGTYTVSLTGRPDRDYEIADVITYELSADETTLTAIEWDESVYGSEALLFTAQPLETLDLGLLGLEEEPAAPDAPVVVEEILPAPTATPVPEEEVTVEEIVTIPEYEVPDGAIAVFVTEVMPAASSPGRVMRLVLFADNTMQMITDYLNDEAPIVELGNWVDNGDGTLSVEILGRALGLYDEAVNVTFTVGDEGGLTATDYPAEVYGSEGIEMQVEFVAQ